MNSNECVKLTDLGEGLVELMFHRIDGSINRLDKKTIYELRLAVSSLSADPTLRGVLISSANSEFIVGADIGEFEALFSLSEEEIAAVNQQSNQVFCALEDLPVPTLVAINGLALGGGLELALCADYRVMSSETMIGLPEVHLGLFPGYGGTVRLPRLASLGVAGSWIVDGRSRDARTALTDGVIDEVASPQSLRDVALTVLTRATEDPALYQKKRLLKVSPLPASYRTSLDQIERRARALAVRHQPAALAALALMRESAQVERDAALTMESIGFASISKTQAASSLVQSFLSQQQMKKILKACAASASPPQQGAVLGAGIMGGGIAYTSALHGIPVRLKDISQAQLDLGVHEANKFLGRAVKSGKIEEGSSLQVLSAIRAQLDYTGFDTVDAVIEAVVENISVKQRVLRELEDVTSDSCVIASNTSSLRIDDIAQDLKRPENFVGMHFFNPVPVMSLVEIVRGQKSSDRAVSVAVSYARSMGKTPIVVKDCPGFLVNRILTPYMIAFDGLIADGADYVQVDSVMEQFGWPMGPAFLQDVIGMDTGSHVIDVIRAGYPERMRCDWKSAIELMAEHKHFGQKNGSGFYEHSAANKDAAKRVPSPDAVALIATVQKKVLKEFSDSEIIERCMLPMILEAVHCLDEGVVSSPVELDTAVLMGIGFPAYLGGALKYADWIGLKSVVSLCDQYSPRLGSLYRAPVSLREMAEQGRTFY